MKQIMSGLALCWLGTLAIAAATSTAPLQGGGSTFVAPIMNVWVSEYRERTGGDVTYASLGSGRGIEGMLDRSFDFGCTDGPLSDAELRRARAIGGEIVHVPLVMGAVAPIYNLPGVHDRLRFSGAVLADIFLGKIERWNDPALIELNAGVPLPDAAIGVVHRIDSSGTTYVWTDYLAKVSPEWKARLGVGKVVSWPVGIGGNGNQGVAGQVKQNPYTIGYAELSYGIDQVVQYGSVRNAAGEFIAPDPASVTTAAEASLAQIPDDLRFSITDAPGAGSYPISGTTWAVAYAVQQGDKGRALVDFLRWTIRSGQERAQRMHYAPLSPGLVRRAEAALDSITVRDGGA